jgi:hypothetical protein
MNTHEKAKASLSRSASQELRQDKHQVEVKIVVPKRLANDDKELRYIESLSHCQISNKEQVR